MDKLVTEIKNNQLFYQKNNDISLGNHLLQLQYSFLKYWKSTTETMSTQQNNPTVTYVTGCTHSEPAYVTTAPQNQHDFI